MWIKVVQRRFVDFFFENLVLAAFYLFLCFSLIKDHRLGLNITAISSTLAFYSNRSPFQISICSCSISLHFSFSFLCQTLSTVCKIFRNNTWALTSFSTTTFASFLHSNSYKVSICLITVMIRWLFYLKIYVFIFEPTSLWSSFQTRFEMFKLSKVVKFSNRNRFLRCLP